MLIERLEAAIHSSGRVTPTRKLPQVVVIDYEEQSMD
jgi:hypothetical protein